MLIQASSSASKAKINVERRKKKGGGRAKERKKAKTTNKRENKVWFGTSVPSFLPLAASEKKKKRRKNAWTSTDCQKRQPQSNLFFTSSENRCKEKHVLCLQLKTQRKEEGGHWVWENALSWVSSASYNIRSRCVNITCWRWQSEAHIQQTAGQASKVCTGSENKQKLKWPRCCFLVVVVNEQPRRLWRFTSSHLKMSKFPSPYLCMFPHSEKNKWRRKMEKRKEKTCERQPSYFEIEPANSKIGKKINKILTFDWIEIVHNNPHMSSSTIVERG